MARRKKAPPWRAVFLCALERSGNVRLAAREAGVDFTSAYSLRKRSAEFREAWARVLGERARAGAENPFPCRGHGEPAHPRPWEDKDAPPPRFARSPSPAGAGENFVVRHSRRAGPQLVRAGSGRWSARAEKAFLDALADHGNIRRAAETAGFSTQALYARRRNSPAFREKWNAAKECGRERIDLLLIEAANRTLDPDAFDVPDGLPKVTIAEAIAILRLHQASEKGLLRGGRAQARAPKMEDVRDEVLRRLAAMRRHRGRN